MDLKFLASVPQIPVQDLARAIAFYQAKMGFALDWKYEEELAGVSRGEARLFLARVEGDAQQTIRVWLNFTSVSEVDALYDEWRQSGVKSSSPPELKPWRIYEFIAADCDGNSFRVFHDTGTPSEHAEG